MAVDNNEFVFRIRIQWIGAIVVLAIGLIVWFILAPVTLRPLILFVAAVIAGTGSLTTAVNNVLQRGELIKREVQNAEKAAKLLADRAAEARVQAALEVLYRWNDPQFFYCKKNVRAIVEYFKDHQNVDDQIAYLKADPDKYANLFDTLNVFEALEIAIASNTVDDMAAKRFFRSIVREYWHRTEGLVKRLRADRSNGRLFCEFESLYNRWNKPT